ncbi:MAG: hypothetical protein AOA65_1301 [Candidatus Bathyarchaeota archaeon BA1]|nr:MAG: hypothetical protein AOA65_1301 [Candidatus Bathyarchaeota archaeon BA1]
MVQPTEPPKDTRFTSRVVGHMEYVDWYLWTAKDYPTWIHNNDPVIQNDGMVAILPRYDDYYLYLAGSRTTYMRYDETLTEGLYDHQWRYLINNKAKVEMITVYSWNEYHERSQIEPCSDYTANVSDVHLYMKTRNYITEFRKAIASNPAPFMNVIISASIFLLILSIVLKYIGK